MQVMNFAHWLHHALVIGEYKDKFWEVGRFPFLDAYVGGPFCEGVFVREGNFPRAGELDFFSIN